MSVYFMQAGFGGPIKIGHGKSPSDRLAGLQTGCPKELILLKEIPGGHAEELALHRLFRKHALRGEWFRPHHSILEFIGNPRFVRPLRRKKLPVAAAVTNVAMCREMLRILRNAGKMNDDLLFVFEGFIDKGKPLSVKQAKYIGRHYERVFGDQPSQDSTVETQPQSAISDSPSAKPGAAA